VGFDWLNDFQQEMEKSPDYAGKTLSSYRLGMKAKGSIAGVRILIDSKGCDACTELDQNKIYHPDDTPLLPLPSCNKPHKCRCVYRPVMNYEVKE
jgi:hypothetical protein